MRADRASDRRRALGGTIHRGAFLRPDRAVRTVLARYARQNLAVALDRAAARDDPAGRPGEKKGTEGAQ